MAQTDLGNIVLNPELNEPRRNGSLPDAEMFPLLAALARRAGRSDLAEEFARRAAGNGVPSRAPEQPRANEEAVAHERRGTQLVREGRLADAETAFRAAIRISPELADAHGNLGVALARQGRLADAEAAFRVALAFAPGSIAHRTNLGTALLDQRKANEAEVVLRQAVHLAPDSADAHRLLGSALDMLGRLDEAEGAFRKAVQLSPNLAEGHYRLGSVLARRDRDADAEIAFRTAVSLKPDHASAWDGICILLEKLGRFADAEAAGRQAVRLRPEVPEHQSNLGVAIAAQDRHAEAEACYREALRLRPGSPLALNNLGNALRSLDRLEEAEQVLRQAVRAQKQYPEAFNNLGITLVQQGKVQEGLTCYDEAIRQRPEYPEARMNRSLAWLGLGDYEQGWPEYEWRWKLRHGPRLQATAPIWDGKPLDGRTLLVYAEQGMGDTLHFIRYAGLVPRGSGGTVVVECQGPLCELVATCAGVDRVIPRGQTLPPADAAAALMSLPRLLGTGATIPNGVPYLKTSPEAVERWQCELARIDGFKVGIAWQGSLQHKGDRIRSVPLSRFAPLAALPGVQLLSLQKGAGVEQLTNGPAASLGVMGLGARLADSFSDTAAAVLGLDLVVCVDTALAHAAGAVGAEIWVLVPFAADWRWLRERPDTPWYPTMRLFRQPRPGDWDTVFARVAAELAVRLRTRKQGISSSTVSNEAPDHQREEKMANLI